MPNPNNCLRYWDLADHIRIDDAMTSGNGILHRAGSIVEKREGSGQPKT